MGVFDKFLNAMKLNDEDEDDIYELDDEEFDEEEKSSVRPKKEAVEEAAKPVRSSKITPISRGRKTSVSMEVHILKPNSVEEAREVTDTLLSNRPVVLNLEGLDVEVAQRIIDFTSGSCYAIGGNLQKVSNYIFIITPSNVDISGDNAEGIIGALAIPPM